MALGRESELLTAEQREVLNREYETQDRLTRLVTLDVLERVMSYAPTQLVEAIQQAPVDRVGKIGRKAGQLAALLNDIVTEDAVVQEVEDQETIPQIEAAEPILEEEAPEEPQPEQTVAVEVQKPQIVAEQAKSKESLPERLLRTVLSPDQAMPEVDAAFVKRLVAHAAIQQRGERGLNYEAILNDLFAGASLKEVAVRYDSSASSIDQSLRNFFKKLQSQGPLVFGRGPKQAPEKVVLPQETLVAPHPVPTPPKEKVVYAQPVEQKGNWENLNKNLDLLNVAITNPNVVSPSEWKEAAHATLYDKMVALGGFSQEEFEGVWCRVHFDEELQYREPVTDHQKRTLSKLQMKFFANNSIHLGGNEHKLQRVAAKTFLSVPVGAHNLDDVRAYLEKEKPRITDTMVQRYTVDGILRIL